MRMQQRSADYSAENPFDGLADVQAEDLFAEVVEEVVEQTKAPVICVAGEGTENHVEGCGHSVATAAWSSGIRN